MKTYLQKAVVTAILAGFLYSSPAQTNDVSDQAEFPQISAQPVDQDVELGGSTTLTVGSTGDGYQWFHNGVALEGATNSNLKLKAVGKDDVGYYSCNVFKGTEVVPTRSANVTGFSSFGGEMNIYSTPISGSGSSGTCPGNYAGYVNYMKTASQGWGWAPTAGETVHVATDQNRSDTKIVYGGKYSDNDCAQTSVTVPHPTISSRYRFTVYFPNNVPTNTYVLTLTGFDP